MPFINSIFGIVSKLHKTRLKIWPKASICFFISLENCGVPGSLSLSLPSGLFDIHIIKKSQKRLEAESKEKHGVWDPTLTITSPYVHSRVDSNTFSMANPIMPESTLSPSQGLWIWPLGLLQRREGGQGINVAKQFSCIKGRRCIVILRRQYRAKIWRKKVLCIFSIVFGAAVFCLLLRKCPKLLILSDILYQDSNPESCRSS